MFSVHRIYQAISPRFRKRRLARMGQTLRLKPDDRVLDVGGYPWCWDPAAVPHQVTILNQAFAPETLAAGGPFPLVVGDGCALPFADRSFDVVFSNSVIEHLGTWENQEAFAREARRVGGRLWVQTPARSFPIEPHYLAPFVHWLPASWRCRLIRYFTPRGWLDRPTPAQIAALVAEIQLLDEAQMQALFPDCEIQREHFLGLTKSYIAVRA